MLDEEPLAAHSRVFLVSVELVRLLPIAVRTRHVAASDSKDRDLRLQHRCDYNACVVYSLPHFDLTAARLPC